MADFKKVKPGQALEIRADAYNAMLEAAEFVRLQKGKGGAGANSTNVLSNPGLIRVQNTTGSALPRFAAVGISDVVCPPTTTETDQATTEFLNNFVAKVRVPTLADLGRFVILRQPLANNAVGFATAIGVCPCKINLNAAIDTTVDISASSTTLQSSPRGSAQILYVAGGVGTATATGSQFALVSLAANTRRCIPCRVQQSGGVAGTNKTVNCTFTYDIYLLDNTTKVNTSGGVITPIGPPRLSNLHYTAATYGEYFIDNNGSYALFLWNEKPDGTVCP